jgi:hypothetical protein
MDCVRALENALKTTTMLNSSKFVSTVDPITDQTSVLVTTTIVFTTLMTVTTIDYI